MAALVAMQSLPTVARPEDVANVTFFLASEQERLILGQSVVADVGITRRP